jgi:riboflavin kinase/FMN adenylyltransferase
MVEHGDGRGRTLGFPTANVAVPAELALPPSGVYAVRAGVVGAPLGPAVANLGTRPTFGPGRLALEVHLLDPPGDLYGATLRVAFVARLRDEARFDSLPALAAQIAADVAAARLALG